MMGSGWSVLLPSCAAWRYALIVEPSARCEQCSAASAASNMRAAFLGWRRELELVACRSGGHVRACVYSIDTHA